MLVTPAAGDPKPRLGGISRGEGGWRLVPLGPEQAHTFFVPFLAKDLGDGVWARLKQAAEEEKVTLKLRGLNSSCHKEDVK